MIQKNGYQYLRLVVFFDFKVFLFGARGLVFLARRVPEYFFWLYTGLMCHAPL
jgi:hypothetical protein